MKVTQDWLDEIPMMQQSPSGPRTAVSSTPIKMILRWFRRCVLLSAMDARVLPDPVSLGGGSFTGPSIRESDFDFDAGWKAGMDELVSAYIKDLDAVPHHFQMHLLHAVEILGYKHPDLQIRAWWRGVYERLVNDLHLHPESEKEMDARLGDSRSGWLARADVATVD